jgi:hypothetical protein
VLLKTAHKIILPMAHRTPVFLFPSQQLSNAKPQRSKISLCGFAIKISTTWY